MQIDSVEVVPEALIELSKMGLEEVLIPAMNMQNSLTAFRGMMSDEGRYEVPISLLRQMCTGRHGISTGLESLKKAILNPVIIPTRIRRLYT
jgi:hypothetical protein